MKIVFVSNHYNHHQSELSKAFYELTDGNYTFIQTSTMSEERIRLGWGVSLPSWVKLSYESDNSYRECIELINTADVVIFGGAPEKIILPRIKANKLTFKYSERIFKKRDFDIPRLLKYASKNFPYRNKNLYYLFSSAYAAHDYSCCGVKKEKMFCWGYFPETKIYDNINSLVQSKIPHSILWVGRLIDWKHPEVAIQIAKKLREDGYSFSINIIGTGVLEDQLKELIVSEKLSECVTLLGSMSPEEVRRQMEKSEVFLFTSDRNEGWGAVLNEAMNSGCAVIASHAIGAAPFLIKNGQTGFLYKSGDVDDLYEKLKPLMDNCALRVELSKNAYHTLEKEWNAYNAAQRFIELSSSLIEKSHFYVDGISPCGKAPLIKDSWIVR